MRTRSRRRRQARRTEFYDSIATMLASGLSLLESVEALLAAERRQRSSLRCMLVQMRQSLHDGSSLAQAMEAHPAWFDGVEVAMVQAGEHGSGLSDVLRDLAERQARSEELAHRLTAALTYPFIVALAGIGVVMFLSAKTLPELAAILDAAKVPVPRLTLAVMAVGRGLMHFGPFAPLGCLALAGAVLAFGRGWYGRIEPNWLAGVRRLFTPRVMRRMALARAALQLAQLVRCGVPAVDALRIVAPTACGLAGADLGRQLLAAAEGVERGEDLSVALNHAILEPEFARLLELGQQSGNLDVLLERLGHRYERHARRLIDRLASVLEPTVVVALAALIGVVVMAAIGPILKLQDIIR